MKSTRRQWIKAAPIAAVSAVAAGKASTAQAFEFPSEPLLSFTSMGGNEPHLNINHNQSDSEAWKVADADGILTLDGHLVIRVIGLIFEDNDPNDENFFRAIFSCTSINSSGDQIVINRSTEDFPTGPAGNALIRSRVTIPEYCWAPIIFVGPGGNVARNTKFATGTGGTWFASTGIVNE